jgi:hypothetical protein
MGSSIISKRSTGDVVGLLAGISKYRSKKFQALEMEIKSFFSESSSEESSHPPLFEKALPPPSRHDVSFSNYSTSIYFCLDTEAAG